MPVDYGDSTEGPSGRKKKKPVAETRNAYVAAQINAPSDSDTTAARIQHIDRMSNRVLPAEVTWSLGTSSLTNRDVMKASRHFARQFNLPVDDYFKRISEITPGQERQQVGTPISYYEDPIHGGPISLRSARRLLEVAEPNIISQWLERTPSTQAPTTGRSRGPGETTEVGVNPRGIIQELNYLTPLIGEGLNYGEALALSRDVTTTRQAKVFNNNLEILLRGAMQNQPRQAVAVAREAALRGAIFTDFVDVTAFLTGATREQVEQGAEAVKPKIGVGMGGKHALRSSFGPIEVVGKLYDAIKNTETSYSEEAKQILEEAQHQREQGDNPVLNGFMATLEFFNRGLDAASRWLGDSEALLQPAAVYDSDTGQLLAGKALEDSWNILKGDSSVYDNDRMKELGWSTGEIMFWELATSIAIPAGVGARAFAESVTLGQKMRAVAMLGGEIAIDPLTSGGKVLRVAGERRFLPLLNDLNQEKVVTRFITEPQRKLGGLDVPTYLDRVVQKSGDSHQMFSEAVGRFRATFGASGIHPLTGRAIYSWSKEAAAAGLDEATRVRGIRAFLAESLGMTVKDPLGKELAARAAQLEARTLEKAKGLVEPLASKESREVAYRQAQDMADQLDRFADDIAITGPIMHEVPRVTTRTRELLVPNLGDTKAARAIRVLGISELPLRQGNFFKFLPDQNVEDAITGLETVMVRARVFSKEEIAETSQAFSGASRASFAEREAAMGNVLAATQARMMKRLGTEIGVLPEDLLEFADSTFGLGTGLKRKVLTALKGEKNVNEVFGSIEKGSGHLDIDRPMFPSQLRNNFEIIDPVRLRKAAKEQLGYMRELKAMGLRVLGQDSSGYLKRINKVKAKIKNLTEEQAALRKAGQVEEAEGIGKALTAAKKELKNFQRPATVAERLTGHTLTPSRVIGEFARDVARPAMALVKLGWVARPSYILRIVTGDELLRFMATEGPLSRLQAGRNYAKIARRFSFADNEVREIATRTGLEYEEAQALRFPGLLPDEGQAGQGAVKYISNMQGDILPPDVQNAMIEQWATIAKGTVDDAEFISAWSRALHQYSVDDIGQQVMIARREGLDVEAGIEKVQAWVKSKEGKRARDRMAQVDGWNVDEDIRNAVEYGWQLTPNKIVGEITEEGAIGGDVLRTLDPELWPSRIHGPAMNPVGSHQNIVKRAVGAWSRAILEMPTNKLIRQPFFKANYSRVYTHLRDQALTQGKTIDEAMDAAMQNEAKRFAIARTREIMFDFTRTGRFAELAWFVNPFLQPFTEFFVAWPRIIKQNPAMLGYANRLGQAASDNGFFQVDEQTGQQVVPASNLLGAAPLLAAITGGKMGTGVGGGWELSMPLAAFNMFTSSAIPIDIGGTTYPIPTPSFSPPAQWALQQFFKRTTALDEGIRVKMMNWLTEYGEVDFTSPQDWALPTWGRRALTAAVPSWFEAETNRNVSRFLALQQAMGQEPDEAKARAQAKSFAYLRAAFSAFFPASPTVKFPTNDLEIEWDELVESLDGDMNKAFEEWAGVWNPKTDQFEGGRHPGLTLIAASKTMWNDEENPWSMPATEAAQRILMSEGGEKFATMYPRWAMFIIPAELRTGELDMGVMNAQIAAGERIVKTPSQFISSANVNAAWGAAFAMRDQFNAWQHAHPDQESGDLGYDARQQLYRDQITAIADDFPEWTGAAQMSFPTGVDPNVELQARTLIESEEFATKTDLGQGLKAFYTFRDKLERDMMKVNVTNLNTSVAEDEGFVKRWKEGTERIIKAHPDFAMVFERMNFDADLQQVETAGQKALDKLPSEVRKEVYNKWSDRWEKYKSAPYDDTLTSGEVFAAYDRSRDFANNAYNYKEFNPLKLWWGTQNPNEKRDYALSAGGRSPVFWSRFDWEVMGGKPTAKTTEFWDKINRKRSAAFERNGTDPDYEVGPALDNIDKEVAQAVKKNKKLEEQLHILNDWGYGIRQVVMGNLKGLDPVATPKVKNDPDTKENERQQGTKAWWNAFFDAIEETQKFVTKQGWRGIEDFDPENAVNYRYLRETALPEYVRTLQKENPSFKRQWDYVQDFVGVDRLIEVIVPESWYPVGAVD